MEYSRIVGVTGMPGLYELVSSKSDGAVVRSLEDGSTKFVSSRVHKLSHLESIEVYTVRENVNLTDVFEAMKGSGEPLPDGKDNKAVKAYFEKTYPDMDFDRVYSSDMKKMVKWFEVLQKAGVEIKRSEPAEESDTEKKTAETPATETTETKEPAEAAAEAVTTLEVGGMDTAETAPKRMAKRKKEEKKENGE